MTTSVDIPIGRHVFEVVHRQADEWLAILLEENIHWDFILPGMLNDYDQQVLEDDLRFGDVSTKELETALFDLLTVVSGRKWYTTVMLCTFLRANWDRLGGELALRGLTNPSRFTFAAWLDAAYATCLKNVDPKQAGTFVSELTSVPPGYEDEIDWEDESRAFLAAMQMA